MNETQLHTTRLFLSLTEAGGHQVEESWLGGLEHVHHADSGQESGDVGWQRGGYMVKGAGAIQIPANVALK